MKKWENLLVVIDKSTGRLIFRSFWTEWPQMIPGNNRFAVRNWRGWNDWTEEDWNQFTLSWSNVMRPVERAEIPLTDEDRARLPVEREKAAVAWRWLNVLYALHRSTEGMIPGIYVYESEAEKDLLEQERQSVKELIRQDLSQYWARIWNASTMEEIESLAEELRFTSRNSQAYF